MDKNNAQQNDENSSNESSSDNEEYLRRTRMVYDPNSSARIICIELENNQHVYINYKENWTIEDLIISIVRRHEFHLLNNRRDNILSFTMHPQLFDLSLCFYDKTRNAHENRMDENVTIDKLHEIRLLKNYRTPFFILKSNYTPLPYIYSGEYNIDQLKEIKNSKYNQYAMYINYLPKITKNMPNLLMAHPELENYFYRNKKGYNEFIQFKTNKLSADIENIDWFIYDKESMNFLMEMEQKEFTQTNSIKYINGKVYFEDSVDKNQNKKTTSEQLSRARAFSFSKELNDKELEKIFVYLIVDDNNPSEKNKQRYKSKITSKTTAFELISKTLDIYQNHLEERDPNKKILKVRSENDYIFNLNEPLINFSYLNECVKLNKNPEYLIIDNPELDEKTSNEARGSVKKRKVAGGDMASSNFERPIISNDLNVSMEERFINNKIDLRNIAYYNATSSTVNNDICKIIDSLEKEVNKGNNYLSNNKKGKNAGNKNNQNQGGKFTLDDLVNLFNQEIENEIDNKIKNYDPNKKENIKTKEEEKNNYLKNENNKKFSFLQLNCNSSKYLKKKSKYKVLPMNQAMPNVYISKVLNNPNNLNLNKNQKDLNSNSSFIKHKNTNSINPPKKNMLTLNNNDKPKITHHTNNKQRNPLMIKKQINLSEINRPFSILFRSADIFPLLNSTDFDTKNITTLLLFRFELYCSSSSICPPRQVRWKTSAKVQKPVFNKRLYFDINYSQLPNSCSVLITIKLLKYDKNNSVLGGDIKFWANYRLFDQNNRLKVGMHKINLHEREICDDIYYLYNDNPDEEKSTKIYFEIESFAYPVVNELQKQIKKLKKKKAKERESEKNEPKLELIPSEDLLEIVRIDKKSPFDDLNNNEKLILWKNRFYVAKMNSLIPRLLLSCDYNNPKSNIELEELVKVINDVSVVQAIELLSGRYISDTVRTFAVDNLRRSNVINIQTYLLQLVQALKYEKNHDNALARFLIEMAVEYPITIGHEFFWHLRSEMFNQDVQQRFGLYLEIFINKITRPMYKVFREEDKLLKSMVKIAEKIVNIKSKVERDKILKNDLNEINNYLELSRKEVPLPLNFKYNIKKLIPEKCRIMKSKKKPLWLTFENADPYGENIVAMLKCGDDLRMDMVTLQLFKAMQSLWFDNGLKLKMSLYKVLCTGNEQGMLEMVTNSETLASIHVKEGGAINQLFSKAGVKNWIEKNCNLVSPNEAVDNFMLSNVAYCLATFVLGIGDRHNDNIMIKKNGELFHIDFGHFLGHFKYKMGIKRERAPFVFTRQFQNVLGGDNSEMFKEFKNKLEKGYIILRNNKEVILTLLRMLLCTGIPELSEKSLRFLESSLVLNLNDKDAIDFLNKKLIESMDSVSTKLNFAIHIVANK